jgi:hypothetical protein
MAPIGPSNFLYQLHYSFSDLQYQPVQLGEKSSTSILLVISNFPLFFIIYVHSSCRWFHLCFDFSDMQHHALPQFSYSILAFAAPSRSLVLTTLAACGYRF